MRVSGRYGIMERVPAQAPRAPRLVDGVARLNRPGDPQEALAPPFSTETDRSVTRPLDAPQPAAPTEAQVGGRAATARPAEPHAPAREPPAPPPGGLSRRIRMAGA